MPFNRASLPELRERIRADIRSRLPESRPEQRRSLLGVLADVEAGGMHALYGFLERLSREATPYTAQELLEDWARTWGVTRRRAEAATGVVRAEGENDVTIPEGARLESNEGETYEVTESATIEDGAVELQVAAVDAGAAGNLGGGEALRFVSAVSGVEGEATVGDDGLTGGAEQEPVSRLRERLLERIQQPPHGGALADYERWARDAHPDVTRVWPVANEVETGTVTVRLMTDGATSDGVPEPSVVESVQSYIDGECPVHLSQGAVFVVPPDPVPLDLQVELTPDTEGARARVQQAVEDFIERESEPGGTIRREQLSGVIYVAAGESRHTLVVPASDVEHGTNEIAVPGSITWGA
ncbi:baseplate J/gp47 family protein [Thioalkalivibrio sp. ALMg9]|uniref:baseplate J/gp47 family protein n=1 Tax=Thioalkalivibrio sp. ALMg9 TaxID=1266912 RepID=UPI00036A4CEC|nr:baseplate J/gp47 family protein [Thioalkalivibrio sp. ALMg9]